MPRGRIDGRHHHPQGTGGAQHSCALVAGGGIRQVAKAVVVGGDTTFAVRDDGSLAGWGANDVGQVGLGAPSAPIIAPADLAAVGNVVQLVAGSQHACALFADGVVKCWGANGSGQLGDGTRIDRSVPTTVVF